MNGDEHRGRCGGGVPGTAVFGTKGGVTGVVSDKLDRPTIGKALRNRQTWATTGERLVALSWCGDNMMGSEFSHSGDAEIEYRFLGDAGDPRFDIAARGLAIVARQQEPAAGREMRGRARNDAAYVG